METEPRPPTSYWIDWFYRGLLRIIGYVLGLYWDNGEENGNYYIIIGYTLGLYGSCYFRKSFEAAEVLLGLQHMLNLNPFNPEPCKPVTL